MTNVFEVAGIARTQKKQADAAWERDFLLGHWLLPGVTIAVDLTMRKTVDGIDWLDHNVARDALKHCLNKVNAHYYGQNFKRRGKRVFVLPVLERSYFDPVLKIQGRLHYHLLLKIPNESPSPEEFRETFLGAWESLRWAYDQNRWHYTIDSNRVRYVAKFKTQDCEVDHVNLNWYSSSLR